MYREILKKIKVFSLPFLFSIAGCGGSESQFGGATATSKGGKVGSKTEVKSELSDDLTQVAISPDEVPNYKSVIAFLDAANVPVPNNVRSEVMNLKVPDGLMLAGPFVGSNGVSSFNLSARTTNTLASLVGIVPSSVVNGLLGTPLGGLLCLPNGILLVTNPSGTSIDINNRANCLRVSGSFVKSFGNGRSCLTCHSPLDSWTLNTKNINERFNSSRGNDPLFRTVDGANCPKADVSTIAAKRQSYSLLLSKGLIRIEQKLPSNAEFKLASATGTYCNEIDSRDPLLSLYRRPLPTTNLELITSVMWDGRESKTGDLRQDLLAQARSAVATHAEAKEVPSDRVMNDAVDLEISITSAQITSNKGFNLSTTRESAAQILARQKLTPNENISRFNTNVFTLFNAFASSSNANQRALYRGQQIFNTKTFNVPELGANTTCSSCHNAPNAGSNTAIPRRFFDNGVATEEFRTSDLPLYTFVSLDGRKTVKVSDPGRAMVTGKWEDIGKFKVPVLRGIAARYPYFHNGSARTVGDVVNFYDDRFDIGLSLEEKLDLTAFLEQL